MTILEWIENNSKKYDRKNILDDYARFLQETGSHASKKSFKKRVYEFYSFDKNRVIPKEDFNKNGVISVKEEKTDKIYTALVTSTWIKTPEDLIKHLGINTKEWKLSKFTRNVWGSETNPNFQVKGDFQIQSKISDEDVLAVIKEKVETFKPVFSESKKVDAQETDNMLEIAIQDHHFGQLSLKSETGEDYNLQKSHDLYIDAVNYMLESAKVYKPSKIVFIVGSDFFNADTPENTTYAGTFQAESSRWKDTFNKGLETCIEAIELCYSKVHNIDIKVVQGNHDYTKAFYLGIALKQRYSFCKDINVDVSEEPRKYVSWGTNLICFTHGDKETFNKLPLIVGKEKSLEFSTAKQIEVHCGHLHMEKESIVMANENALLKYRILPSLVAIDDWHKEKGFFHLRESQSFIWNKTKGNIAIFKYHI